MLRYLCFLAVILGANSAAAPSLKPCSPKDTKCIIASAQAFVPIMAPGIPELNVPSLDPLLLKVVKSKRGGLDLTMKDTTVTGLKDCTIEDAQLKLADETKGKLDVVVRCSVILRGSYKLKGQVLVLPIWGEGKDTIKLQDIVITANTSLVTVKGADGQQHWHINQWGHTFDVRTKTSFHFDNLFGGNTALADTIESVVNSQWRVVMSEIAPPIVRAITERVVDAVDALFAAVPSSELHL